MGRLFQSLNEDLESFIKEQKCFFVATSPNEKDGFVNVSPKGYDTFIVLNEKTVAYLDYPGSGNETARHIHKGSKVTIMFCGFEDRPLIVRLYGSGEVIDKETDRFLDFKEKFGATFGPWVRQIIILHIEQIKASCGEAVPFYKFMGEREDLHRWAVQMNDKGKLDQYISNHK